MESGRSKRDGDGTSERECMTPQNLGKLSLLAADESTIVKRNRIKISHHLSRLRFLPSIQGSCSHDQYQGSPARVRCAPSQPNEPPLPPPDDLPSNHWHGHKLSVFTVGSPMPTSSGVSRAPSVKMPKSYGVRTPSASLLRPLSSCSAPAASCTQTTSTKPTSSALSTTSRSP